MTILHSIRARLPSFAKKKPFWVASGCFLIGAILFVALRGSGRTGAGQMAYHPVKRGDFLISIVEGGTIKAVHEVTVRSELEGVARILSIAPEGTYVKKGDLLVELDSSDLRDRLNAQEVTYENAHFAYLQGKEYLAIQKSMGESNIKDAELKLEFAQSDLEKYKEGDAPQQKKNTEAKITIAAVQLERAKDRLNWTQLLQKKGYATRSQLEADSLNVKKSEIELDQAKEELRLLTKYDVPKRIRQLEANLEQAEKELERIKQRSAAQIAQVDADLSSKKTAMELQETRLNQLKEQLKLTKLYAPEAGLVIYASSSSPGSGVLIEEGATVRQKQDIIKLPDISQMMIEVRVHESHVQKIKPGLSAYVTIDSLPDQQFKGTVRKVAVLPDSTSRYYNPNLKVYATEVLIEDELPDLKPGISGRAEIIITNLTQVVTVPIQAVTTHKGRQVCFVQKGSSAKPVPVEVGMYNDQVIEIKTGLKEGDQVLLAAIASGDSIDLSGSIIGAEDNESTNKAAARNSEKSVVTNSPAQTQAINLTQTNIEALQLAAKSTTNFVDFRKDAFDHSISNSRSRTGE